MLVTFILLPNRDLNGNDAGVYQEDDLALGFVVDGLEHNPARELSFEGVDDDLLFFSLLEFAVLGPLSAPTKDCLSSRAVSGVVAAVVE